MKLVTVSEMIAVERQADASGLNYAQMMENAGRNLAEVILEEYGFLEEEGALALVGSGNNGGDALVALEYLSKEGWQTCAYIARPRPEDDPLVARLQAAGGQIVHAGADPQFETLTELLGRFGLLLDGVLGTGFKLPLKEELASLLGFVRQRLYEMDVPPSVVAVDCPSGVDCDSGQAAAECIPAEATITMAAIKQGLFKFPAYNLLGVLHLVGIGLPEGENALPAWQELRTTVVSQDWVRRLLPARPLDAHKGSFGTALVVAGSVNYCGAALLAGEAAYRGGAGLVTVATPASVQQVIAGRLPEATWLILPEVDGVIGEFATGVLRKNLEHVSAMLVGPGFGLDDAVAAFVRELLSASGKPSGGKIGFLAPSASANRAAAMPPMVWDADGLKLLARIPDWPAHLPAPAVLTPHPGEMAVLTGLSKEQIQAERVAIARRYSQQWGHVVVLKGAFTVVAAPDGQVAVIPVATPALARAGTGDVLAGLIVGLRAQGLDAYPAAVAGAWIHAQAGLEAAYQLGSSAAVLAGDVLAAVKDVMANLE